MLQVIWLAISCLSNYLLYAFGSLYRGHRATGTIAVSTVTSAVTDVNVVVVGLGPINQSVNE